MLFHRQIEAIYRKITFARYDDNGLCRYFTHNDFPGLTAQPYAFPSSHGHTLRGNFYSYSGYDSTRLILFEHGIGGGHLSYMKEIDILCRAGYRVFSYDHSGCMSSGGADTGGLSRSLCDLDDCIKALKTDGLCPDDLSVVGHSWGGYSALNIAAFHPDIRRVVVLSGFVSVAQMIRQNFGGILRGYQKHILQMEQASNPGYAEIDGVTTLAYADTRALLIYSDDDPVIPKALHYDVLHAALQGKDTVTFRLESGKRHNPNYTKDAVALLGSFSAASKKTKKRMTSDEKAAFCSAFDWDAMTAQDEDVWQQILAFLK